MSLTVTTKQRDVRRVCRAFGVPYRVAFGPPPLPWSRARMARRRSRR